MTQIQVDYNKAMETRRHNFEMERLGSEELDTKRTQAAASLLNAQAKTREVDISEQLLPYNKDLNTGKTFESVMKGMLNFSGVLMPGSLFK